MAFALTSLYETMMNLSQLIRVLRRGRGRWGNTSELRMNWETSSLRGFGAEDHDGNSLNSSSHYTSNQMLFIYTVQYSGSLHSISSSGSYRPKFA